MRDTLLLLSFLSAFDIKLFLYFLLYFLFYFLFILHIEL